MRSLPSSGNAGLLDRCCHGGCRGSGSESDTKRAPCGRPALPPPVTLAADIQRVIVDRSSGRPFARVVVVLAPALCGLCCVRVDVAGGPVLLLMRRFVSWINTVQATREPTLRPALSCCYCEPGSR